LNVDDLNEKILKYKENVKENGEKTRRNNSLMEDLKSEYDEEKLEKQHLKIKKLNEDGVDLKLDNSHLNNKIDKEKAIIDKIDTKIKTLKEKEIEKTNSKIEDLNDEIEELKKEFNRNCDKEKDNVNLTIKDKKFDIKTTENELENIKKDGKRIKSEIKEIEEDVNCPTCGREYDDTHKEHKEKKINKLKEDLEKLMVPVKEKLNFIKITKDEISDLEKEIEEISNKNYKNSLKDLYDDLLKDILIKEETIKDWMLISNKIENEEYDDCPELVQKIKEGLKLKEKTLLKIKEFKEQIQKNDTLILDNKKIVEELEKSVFLLEKDREEFKNWSFLNSENKEIRLKNENIKLHIENLKNKIELYYNQLENIEWNKTINKEIETLNEKIENKEDEIETLNENLSDKKEDLVSVKKDLENCESKIEKWKKQIKQEELFKEYSKIISRDGIPTYLLKQSINLINAQLDTYLTDVDFVVYFDKDLKLKLSAKNRLDISQSALESSGKERTFIALALKMALRTINNKPKSNFMMLDEVMGKLKNNSVDEFLDMVKELKENIDKILIIEPNHNIDYDYIIKVKKDKNGVSLFEFN
jgi:DNA repair exonuclease SbcCD ATPase subunit